MEFGGNPKLDLSRLPMADIATWLELNPPVIPLENILGYKAFVENSVNDATFLSVETASVGAEAHTTSSTYADPSVSGGVGPEITGLKDGKYLVFFGGSGGGDFAANVTYHMGVSINGSTPTDDQSAEYQSDRGNTSGMMLILATLSGGTNTLKAVYRSSDGTDRGNIRYRWIVSLRIGS